jgi:hypothetical protein
LSVNGLADNLDEVTLAWLVRQSQHVALDGRPCWLADELLALLDYLSHD